MDISAIANLAGSLSPLVMAVIAIIAFWRGEIVSQRVVESIIVKVTEQVLASCKSENEQVVAEISARIMNAFSGLLDEHEQRIIRELDRKPGTGNLIPRRHL